MEVLCKDVCHLARKVGAFIRNERKTFSSQSVEHKGKNDLVSYVDKSAEKQIVDELIKLLPQAGFITEEETNSTVGEQYNWIVDPLDGTTNFVHGLPVFSISIALMEYGQLVLGVVYEVNLDECFYAWKEGPAMLNDKVISVSKVDSMQHSLIATGFPYTNFSRFSEYLQVFEYCMRNTHGLRRLGSAAVDLVYVACGRFEAFYEYGLQAWDVAAGAFIVQQAGGRVSDFAGGDKYVFGKELLATNSKIHSEFLAVVKEKFASTL